MKLSIIIPAKNEEGNLEDTIKELNNILLKNNIQHEIIVIDDHSSDNTLKILNLLKNNINELKIINNTGEHGYGLTVRLGLENYSGEIIAIMMADGSDSPKDLLEFYFKSIKNNTCIFGSRFIDGGSTKNYQLKYVLNRIFNNLVRIIFQIRYNDITNAFKVYTKEAIEGSKPFLSNHFNLTLELPLKIIIRGYNYEVIPNSWRNRKTGISKNENKRNGKQILVYSFYCLIEKLLTKNDYKKNK